MDKKKIVYVVGCGRSGTTLLGFALGNSVRSMDLGEVLDFVRFRGRPNDFGPGTDNYCFWDSVLRDVQRQMGKIDFARLAELQSRVDTHKSFLPLVFLGNLFRRNEVSEYRRFLHLLYGRILAESSFDVVVDSSKYPSRLWHLRAIFRDEHIHVIHLIRNPIELTRAMQNGGQSGPRTFLGTIVYFFVINFFSLIATRGLGPDRYVRLHYEDMVSRPENALTRIGSAFSLDTRPAVDKISSGQPLRRGYVFNGNRMRTEAEVVLRKSTGVTAQRSLFERAFERVAGLAFGAADSSQAGRHS
jgi:hypothetical protein